ncbi:hypothetical protein, partial [Mycobacteroides abscessus]|uniref:hypothetical protein n=1 Tax=Mycobacteroides abscessus TaxID=36809 RepID=UPI0013F6183D
GCFIELALEVIYPIFNVGAAESDAHDNDEKPYEEQYLQTADIGLDLTFEALKLRTVDWRGRRTALLGGLGSGIAHLCFLSG